MHRYDARGSLIDYESHKIKKTMLSTTVAELYSLMKCFGTCLFMRGLWMDLTGEIADVHIRTDAKNLVTTAQTTHLPEQKETMHMIQMLRHDACSGQIDDLAHVESEDMMADCLTKSNCPNTKYLIDAVNTSWLPRCDKQMPFREMMEGKHKAFFMKSISSCIPRAPQVYTFLGGDIREDIHQHNGQLDLHTERRSRDNSWH